MLRAAFDNVYDRSGVIWECLGTSEGVLGVLSCVMGAERGCLVDFSLQFPSILGRHELDPWRFPVDLEGPEVSYIKMSQRYGHFDLLGSFGRGFRAEL